MSCYSPIWLEFLQRNILCQIRGVSALTFETKQDFSQEKKKGYVSVGIKLFFHTNMQNKIKDQKEKLFGT